MELHPRREDGRRARIALRVGNLRSDCRGDLAADLRDVYRAGLWAFDSLANQPGAEILHGRRRLVAARLSGVPVLVKRLFHGGMLRRITRDRFLTPARLRTHLATADFLAAHSVATPETLFASWRRVNGFIRGEIGVRFISDAVDASHYLFAKPEALPEDWRRRVGQIGAMVATLHSLAVLHGDLNLRNFLFLSSGEVSILDLDKARRRSRPLSRLQRRRNLRRLERSVRKQGRAAPAATVASLTRELRAAYANARAQHSG